MKNMATQEQQKLFPSTIVRGQRRAVMVITAVTIIEALVAWWLYRRSLSADLTMIAQPSVWLLLLLTALGFFFLFSLVATMSVLVPNAWWTRVFLFCVACTYCVQFGFDALAIAAAILFLADLWYYDWSVKSEQHERLRFSVNKVMSNGLSFGLTVLFVVLTVTFYSHASRQAIAMSPLDRVTDRATESVNKVLAVQIPGYQPDESLDTFLLQIAADRLRYGLETGKVIPEKAPTLDLQHPSSILEQLSNLDVSTLLDRLPLGVREQITADPKDVQHILQEQKTNVLDEQFAAARDQLLNDLGVSASGSTSVRVVVRSFIGKQVHLYLGPYERFLPTLFALTYYFTLQIFSFLYVPAILALTAFLFAVLSWTRVIHTRTVDATVSYVTLAGDEQ